MDYEDEDSLHDPEYYEELMDAVEEKYLGIEDSITEEDLMDDFIYINKDSNNE